MQPTEKPVNPHQHGTKRTPSNVRQKSVKRMTALDRVERMPSEKKK